VFVGVVTLFVTIIQYKTPILPPPLEGPLVSNVSGIQPSSITLTWTVVPIVLYAYNVVAIFSAPAPINDLSKTVALSTNK
jgi:hypothetical protein